MNSENIQLTIDTSKCEERSSYDGDCCCNCTYQVELRCHPWNKNFGKGNITQICGYACIATEEIDYDKTIGFFTDGKHGMCELHVRKQIQFKDNEKLFL